MNYLWKPQRRDDNKLINLLYSWRDIRIPYLTNINPRFKKIVNAARISCALNEESVSVRFRKENFVSIWNYLLVFHIVTNNERMNFGRRQNLLVICCQYLNLFLLLFIIYGISTIFKRITSDWTTLETTFSDRYFPFLFLFYHPSSLMGRYINWEDDDVFVSSAGCFCNICSSCVIDDSYEHRRWRSSDVFHSGW